MGTVCLTIKGVRVDPSTGEFVAIQSKRECLSFGFPLHVAVEKGPKLFWRTWPDEPELSHEVQFPELGLLELGRRPLASKALPNTLLLYVDRMWDGEIAATLTEGLERSRRRDAGLQVIVLFKEGALNRRLAARVEDLASSLGAPVLVNEDAQGAWSTHYALPSDGGDAWRLISPGGGVTWMHNGRLRGETLAHALDQCLIPSKSAKARLIRSGTEIGAQVSAIALHPGYADLIETELKCPPISVGRLGVGSVIAFVQAGSAASHAQIQELRARYAQSGEDRPFVAIVVGDADARTAEALKQQLELEFPILADPNGTISRRFGVRFWPTTLTLDRKGVVSDVAFGHRTRMYQDRERKPSAE